MSEDKKHCCGCAERGEHGGAAGRGACCCGAESGGGRNCCGIEKGGILGDGARLLVSLAALAAGFCISAFHLDFPFFPFSDPSWIAVLLCGLPIFKGAYNSLVREGSVTSALLISVAMVATIALQFFMLFVRPDFGHAHDSYIFAAGEIAFLMALGEAIEGRTVAKTRAGVEALVKLAPQTAFLERDGAFAEVAVSEIRAGDVVLVKPNGMISVDGVILSGGGAVDQSSMTGESVPVDKCPGDQVFAGTWNKSDAMTIRAERAAKDSAIAKLIALVEEAEGRKAPIARVANKWAARIVPAAIISSVLVFAYARLVLDAGAVESLVRGVTILVVFCPCAFALATPTAIAAGLGNAARRGILIKSGGALEELSRVSRVVFDKTGTLTTANLKVEGVRTSGMGEEEFLKLCAGAEAHSEHPIAKAVLEYASGRVALEAPESTRSLAGIGVESVVGGRRVEVMSFAALEKSGADFSGSEEYMRARLKEGETLVCALVDSKFAGVISLSDQLRPGAAEAVAALKAMGYGTCILTGDNAAAAARVAAASGVDEVFAELLPGDKARKILELKEGGARVCMIGDGVNDAPALANADVSVAMGALGSDLAVETADAAFLNDRIDLSPGLFRLSRTVMNTIRANITLSLSISFLAVVAGAYGLFGPGGGALVHNASSVIVVLNSASILGRKKLYAG